jgi:hypothetical protein
MWDNRNQQDNDKNERITERNQETIMMESYDALLLIDSTFEGSYEDV